MNVGLHLRGPKRDEVQRGQVLSAPGVIRPFDKGRAEIFVLTAEDGGRHTAFTSGYSPQVFFGVTDITGVIVLTEDLPVLPGDRADIGFVLNRPDGIETGVRFALREGGKTVGTGIVTEVATRKPLKRFQPRFKRGWGHFSSKGRQG